MNVLLNEWSRAWGVWILEGIIPAVVLAALLLGLERLRRGVPARLAIALWAIVLARPFWPSGVGTPAGLAPVARVVPTAPSRAAPDPAPDRSAIAPAATAADAAIAPGPAPAPPATANPSFGSAPLAWHAWLLLAWCGAIPAWMALRWIRSRRLRGRLALRELPPDIFEDIRRWLEEAGLHAPSRIRVSTPAPAPLLLGILRPLIVLPDRFLDSDALRSIVIHERIHQMRCDPLRIALAEVARLAHIVNPAVWIAARRIRALAEEACDEETGRRVGDARDYASALVEVSAGLVRMPAGVAFAETFGRSRLARRVERILAPPRALPASLCALAALVWIATAAVTLPGEVPARERGAVAAPDRAVRLSLPQGSIEADSISIDPDGLSRLRADPGREVEARIAWPAGRSPESFPTRVAARGLSIERREGQPLRIHAAGPLRFASGDGRVSATAKEAVATSALPGDTTFTMHHLRIDEIAGTWDAGDPEGAGPMEVRAPKIEVVVEPEERDGALGHLLIVAAPEGIEIRRERPPFSIRADRAMLFRSKAPPSKAKLTLQGDVRIETGAHAIRCERAEWDAEGLLRCTGSARVERTDSKAKDILPAVRRISVEGASEIIVEPEEEEEEGGER
ncbi:MAG: M56 family metallopeptidase [Planctomycetes bacterium]|nr:M56 family metallopeptidase [Planctomycetota bacterium]